MVACFLTIIIMITIFPLVKETIEARNGHKPKAYFQFWASQVIILALGIWIVVKNSVFNNNGINTNVDNSAFVSVILSQICLTGLMIPFYLAVCQLTGIDISTPTQCCCCIKNLFHIILIIFSLMITSSFILIFISMIPSIIFIYYLYPVETLAHLPFVINSILYVNSLTALLLYQCERCFSPCTSPESDELNDKKCCGRICVSSFQKERASAHYKYYHEYCKYGLHGKLPRQDRAKFISKFISCSIEPLGTIIVLVVLVLFIVILSDLLNMDRSKFTDRNQMELLFTLVPTITLLFGSVYNLDFFFKDGSKSKSEGDEPNQFTPLLINSRHIATRNE